jgi:hypothetical protein
MSSSTSSSEEATSPAGAHTDAQWRRWLFALVGSIVAAMAAIYVAVLMLDPFSTGRLTPITRIDVTTRHLTMGHVARIRDLSFDAAIIGNSHGMVFDPGRLGALTGRTFAQLSGPGYGPLEQFLIARAFVRERRGRAPALISVLDEFSCRHDDNLAELGEDFPAFLFESSTLTYLRRIFAEEAIKSAAYRVLMLAGLAGDRRRRDGVYQEGLDALAAATPKTLAQLNALERPDDDVPADWPFPAVVLWQTLLAQLDPETRLLMYFGPEPLGKLPLPGSPAEARLAACKAAYTALAKARPHSALLDRQIDNAFARDIANFADPKHFRSGYARLFEPEIAAHLNAILPAR